MHVIIFVINSFIHSVKMNPWCYQCIARVSGVFVFIYFYLVFFVVSIEFNLTKGIEVKITSYPWSSDPLMNCLEKSSPAPRKPPWPWLYNNSLAFVEFALWIAYCIKLLFI
jgi:hypothetical protein